jgi:hypothetical protein
MDGGVIHVKMPFVPFHVRAMVHAVLQVLVRVNQVTLVNSIYFPQSYLVGCNRDLLTWI